MFAQPVLRVLNLYFRVFLRLPPSLFRLRLACLAASAGGAGLANVQPQPDKMVGPVAC